MLDFGDLQVVIGRSAITLDHVAAAIDPSAGEVVPRRVHDPVKPYTFSLTVVEIPNSKEIEVPGVTTGSIFSVSLWALTTHEFAMGTWLYTIRDTAIVSCSAIHNSGVFNHGELGLLRLPKELVIPYLGQHIPAPILKAPPALVELWNRIDPYDHRFVGLVFPVPYPRALITGQWDVEPADSLLDQASGFWPGERVRREAMFTPEERAAMQAAAEKERRELVRIEQEMEALLRDPPEGSSDDSEDRASDCAEGDSTSRGSSMRCVFVGLGSGGKFLTRVTY